MSENASTPQPEADLPGNPQKSMVPLISLVVAALAILLALISLFVALDASSDAAAARKQVKSLNKSLQTMIEEADAPKPRRGNTNGAKSPAASGGTSEPRATHVDAADPSRDCMVRSGKPGDLAGCLQGGKKH